MKRTEVKIEGKAYPSFMTMLGAMLFCEVTGHELADFDGTSTRDICAFVYGCTRGASLREGVDFPYSFEQFCSWLTPEEVIQICAYLNSDTAEKTPSQKKTTRRS